MPNIKIGYLPQEPQLDPEQLCVKEAVEGALGEVFEARAKLEEVYAAYADENATSTPSPMSKRVWKRSSLLPLVITLNYGG